MKGYVGRVKNFKNNSTSRIVNELIVLFSQVLRVQVQSLGTLIGNVKNSKYRLSFWQHQITSEYFFIVLFIFFKI